MRFISIKTYLGILSAVISIVIILIVIFIVIPTIDNIINSNRELSIKIEEIGVAKKKASNPEKSLKELDELEQRISVFNTATIESGKELELIKTFESIAETYGISQTLKLGGSTKGEYHFSFLNKGLFIRHVQFLHALEKLPYYVNIQKIDWSSDRLPGQVIARFDATIYASTP